VLCSARGAHDVPVSEWVLAAILSDVKNLATARDHQREERWVTEPVGRLKGSTVLLLGYGSIARAVEDRLQPFGVRILRIARRPRAGVATMEALPALLPQADIVVILLALTPETAGTVDAAFLRRMKSGALLVNAARGRLVDTGALLQALEGGRVRAVLDVTDPEPLPAGHPLWRAPGALITPHVGGNTADWQKTTYILARAQLQRWVRGEPLLNLVEAGY
jgi:phosphoglycerate dehydrogenase-like enzyme